VSITALIVDDEAVARSRLRRLLSKQDDVEILGEASDGPSAVEAILEKNPQVVFLDVEMPQMDGFAVLSALPPEKLPAVVFVTAYDAHALRAFSVHALDYLLKPFDSERLGKTMERVRDTLSRNGSPSNERLMALLKEVSARTETLEQIVARPNNRFIDRILVKSANRSVFVKLSDIEYMEAAGNYIRLHVGNERHLVRETMTSLEEKVDPAHFVRIHRSTIVNLDRVKEFQPWFSGDYVVIMQSGARVKLSRGYREALMSRLEGRP
jgi:two-component system, LytTR family, response regulator